MGRTSATVKNRYNSKAYDRIGLIVPKGRKEEIKAYAESKGYSSLNSFVCALIEKEMKSADE